MFNHKLQGYCCGLLNAAALLLAGAGAAHAQLLDQYISPSIPGVGVEPGVTVQSRTRPEFDAPGVRVGNIVIRPLLTESAGYESNVLGTSKPTGSAFIETNASVSAASDWSRNSVRSEVTVDDLRYFGQPKQSYTNWTATLGGVYDVGRDMFSGQYQHFHLNQTTRDLDVPQVDEPLSYDVDMLSASYRLNFNRAYVTPALAVSNYTYANGTAGGLPYVQTYRNRVLVMPSITVGYAFEPLRSAVLVLRDGSADYTTPQQGVPRRNYNDSAALGGLDYDLTGLLRFRVLGGFEARVFSSAAYRTIQAPIIEASAIWTPTGLTTITGTISRHIQDTADETTAAFTDTTILLSIDHEYLRNVLLRGTGRVDIGEYPHGIGDQTLYSASASASYLANRYLRFSAEYDFLARQSSSAGTLGSSGQTFGSSYTDHRVLLRVKLSL